MPQENSQNDTETWFQLARSCHRKGDFLLAEQYYRDILSVNPKNVEAHHFLGILFHQTARFDEALAHYETAISLCPANAVFLNNYGATLKELKRFESAQSAFQKAVELDAEYADAHSNLGLMYLLRDNWKQAEISLTTALKLQPNHIDARKHIADMYFRKAQTLSDKDDFSGAHHCYHRAADFVFGKDLWRLKSLGFCPTVFSDEHSIDVYWQRLNEGLDIAWAKNLPLDWRTLPYNGFCASFNLPHLGKCCREVKEKFARLFRKAFSQSVFKRNSAKRKKNRQRIRIGFVVTTGHHSGFLRVHQHLLEGLDPNRFEVFLFTPVEIVEICRQKLHRSGINFCPLSPRFDLAVAALFEAECDILYHWKAGGGTLDYFLAMCKAAPIQCTSYGTHGTSGLVEIDFYLSSSERETPDSGSYYTEKLVPLQCHVTAHQPLYRGKGRREEWGLPAKGALYFCPHRLPKYQPCFDSYLRAVLEKDSTGYIVLMTGRKPELAEMLFQRLRTKLGEQLFKRVIRLDIVPYERYLDLFSVMTCVLDSPVFAGDLTTHDAFAHGVPVVSLAGNLPIQRTTECLYRMMGMESMISFDETEYVDTAVQIGTDYEFRESIRQKILEKSEAIFDEKNNLREYESFFYDVTKTVHT